MTVIVRWFWVDEPSLYRFVLEGTRFAAVDPRVMVHPGLGTCGCHMQCQNEVGRGGFVVSRIGLGAIVCDD